MTKRKEKTSIQIMHLENGEYIIFFFDKEAYTKLDAGVRLDNISTSFDVKSHGGNITDIYIDLCDGKPQAVRILEE